MIFLMSSCSIAGSWVYERLDNYLADYFKEFANFSQEQDEEIEIISASDLSIASVIPPVVEEEPVIAEGASFISLTTNVNAFANTYFIGSSAPSGGTIGSGDLWYDTNTSQMKVYNGSSWVTFISTYDTDDLSEGSSNQYHTTTRARGAISGGTGISYNSGTGAITTNDGQIVHDNLSGFVANEHIDHTGVSIIAGKGLVGGGTIASSRTLNVDDDYKNTSLKAATSSYLTTVDI